MKIRYGYKIEVACDVAMPMITMLDVHPSRRGDILEPDTMVASARLDGRRIQCDTLYRDQFDNLCRRMIAPAGGITLEATGIIHDTGMIDILAPDARAVPPEHLPSETLVYLMGSRYCETDRLTNDAWAMFGHIQGGWSKVQTVCNYVHNHIRFDYALARNTRTAAEAFQERIGVCRDFAHLAIALCRCLNIPARYCTGYLGDIGVPPDVNPMDFSAWFEAYLDGQWFTFDPRNNRPRIGRVVIARGRDATDVPIINSFGQHTLSRFDVVTDEIAEPMTGASPAMPMNGAGLAA